MTSEQAFQQRKNAASNSVSRYGGTTWAAGAGSVDLEIEAEDEPPGAARLNPGDTSYTHVGDNHNNNATTDSVIPDSVVATVSHANDHATHHNITVNGDVISTPSTTSTNTNTIPSPTSYVPIEGSRVPTELLSGLDPIVADRVGVSVSWVNPKLRACTSTTGSGMFAIQHITKGEHLIVWTGKIVTAEEALAVMDTEDKHYLLQIGDGFYQTPLSSYREPADYTNHSCEPTAGFGKGSPICLSAMCDIPVGGQVLFDYGMCETDPRLWEPMECLCGTSSCRKWITANDWYLYPELWERYAGFWAPHVQRKIDTYRAELDAKKKVEMNSTKSSQILSLPSIDIFDSPAFTPMQVSSSSPSSSGSSTPISTPSSSPPSSPTSHTTTMVMLSTDIQPSSRLSQAKAKAKAKLAKQAEKEKSIITSVKKVKNIKLSSQSSSSSSGDESEGEGEERVVVVADTTHKIEYVEPLALAQPFYLTWMDRMLAIIGLQRIAAASSQ